MDTTYPPGEAYPPDRTIALGISPAGAEPLRLDGARGQEHRPADRQRGQAAVADEGMLKVLGRFATDLRHRSSMPRSSSRAI